MNNIFPTILRITLGCLFATASMQADVILADFDQPHATGFKVVAPLEKADFDGDGDLEGKITGNGFKTIIKYRITRDMAAKLLETTPILHVELSAPKAETEGNFLSVLPMIQTNANGQDIYEPVKSLVYNPWNVNSGGFMLDLGEVKTDSIQSFPGLLSTFAAGGGDHLFICLVQQTAKNANSTVYYDNIKLTTSQ